MTVVTFGGANPHWSDFVSQANLTWANDYAEGFISDEVISVELLHSSWTSKVPSLGPDVRMTLRQGLCASRGDTLRSISVQVGNELHDPFACRFP